MEPDKRKQRFELYETIILSIAILGTAWSAYQAALWSGIQTFRLAAAAASSRAAMEKHWIPSRVTVLLVFAAIVLALVAVLLLATSVARA